MSFQHYERVLGGYLRYAPPANFPEDAMFLFVLSVSLVLGISALCSLSEAALYSVRTPYVRQLNEANHPVGHILSDFKLNMERPITTILIVNTVANTAGATLAGVQAKEILGDGKVFGVPILLVFSILFTLSVLILSEILPKVAGVAYNRTVSLWVSRPVALATWLLSPFVSLSQRASAFLRSGEQVPVAPEEEVHQLAALSAEEGSILPVEAALVQNVLRLNEITAREIMTPRTVVFKLKAETTVQEIIEEIGETSYTRIPIYEGDDPDDWHGIVLKGDLLACLARDEFETRLLDLQKPLAFVPETLPGHRLLETFLRRREHMLGVLDEFGGVLGVVTLEDVMESLIGEEIIDETDLVVDHQVIARRHGEHMMRLRALPETEENAALEPALDDEPAPEEPPAASP